MKKFFRWFWFLVFAEAVSGGVFVLGFGARSEHGVFFGLSYIRLALVLAFFVTAMFALSRSRARSFRFEADHLGRVGLWLGWALSGIFLFFASPYARGVNYEAIFLRLVPWLIFLSVFAVQSVVAAGILHGSLRSLYQRWHGRGTWLTFLLTLIFFVGLRAVALRSGLGLSILSGTFYRQGVSLLEGPLALGIWGLFPFMALAAEIGRSEAGKRFTAVHPRLIRRVSFLLIWLIAAWIWVSVPFEGRSYFVPALRPPNFNFYPSSDAENYDLLAWSVLLGNGFRNGMTVVRPLYIVFLSALHWIAGTDYLDLTTLQMIVLALIPALIFRLGSVLRLRWGGLLGAVWVIAREATAIRLTPLIQVSNSRLLMSELPMMLMILWLANVGVSWMGQLYDDGKTRRSTVILGGVAAGMGILVRTQSFVLVPALIGLALIVGYARFGRNLFRSLTSLRELRIGLFCLSVLLTVAPWFVYNFAFPNMTVRSDASEGAYLNRLYARAAGEPYDTDVSILSLVRDHPAEIGAEIAGHLFNNLLSSVLVLPFRTDPIDEPGQVFFDRTNFWYRESSSDVLSAHPWAWLAVSVLLALGCAEAVRQGNVRIAVPWTIAGTYLIGCALAMNSGFRFILPVDWIVLFGVGLGVETVFTMALGMGTSVPVETDIQREADVISERNELIRIVWSAVLLLLIALLLPIVDVPGLAPKRTASQLELFSQWKSIQHSSSLVHDLPELEEDVRAGRMELVRGTALYPRIYLSLDGDADGVSSIKRGKPYPRLVWMMLTDDGRVLTVGLPLNCRETMDALDDPAEILVLGKREDDYFAAITVDSVGNERVNPYAFESALGLSELLEGGK